MQRFYHRPGAGVVIWRQAASNGAVSTVSPTSLHRKIYSRGRVVRVLSTQQSVASSGVVAYPAGASARGAVGTPIAIAGANTPATALPAGVSVFASVGTPTATGAAKALPSGVSASSAVGTPIATGGASIPATATPAGVSASAAVGTPIATGQAKALPVGVSVTSAVGTPVAVAGASGAATAYPVGVVTYSSVGALVAISIPGFAVYPSPSNVLLGVTYGPTGADYTGTATGVCPSAADIAIAVWNHTQ